MNLSKKLALSAVLIFGFISAVKSLEYKYHVLLDDFQAKVIDEYGNIDFTNQNAIANSLGDRGGFWYAYASANGAFVSTVEEVLITVVRKSEEAYASDSLSMLKTIAKWSATNGEFLINLDVLDVATGLNPQDYFAAVTVPFLGVEPDQAIIDLSKLKGVRIKGSFDGAVRITIESHLIDYGHWGWEVGGNRGEGGWGNGFGLDGIDIELSVNDMTKPYWTSHPDVDRETAMANAGNFSIQLDTEKGTRSDIRLERINLVFETENDVPQEFNGLARKFYDWSATEITVSNEEEFRLFATEVNGGRNFQGQTIILANNVDFQGNSENQWNPIGTQARRFSGTFDGNDNIVSGIYINRPGIDNQGLFGQIDANGVIKNLAVSVNISGGNNVGGLAGINDGRIEKSYVVGNVAGNNNIGGLAGQNKGTIENAYSAASISGNNNVGGFLGNNSGTIRNSYSVGDVNGQFFVGAFAGNNESGSVIVNSYASATVTADIVFEEGFVGHNSGLIGQSGTRNFEEMTLQSTFNNWDFANIWAIDENLNNGLPHLRGIDILATSIRSQENSDTRFGILLENAVVSDFARISVITPEPAQINIRVFDAVGNPVWTASGRNTDAFAWNLVNNAGRFVASGTYLIIVEATGLSQRIYLYQTKIGVRR